MNRSIEKKITVITLAFCMSLSVAHCGEVLDFVKKNLTEMVNILTVLRSSPKEDTQAFESAKERARKIIVGTFDFNVLSRRSLGVNFKKFSEVEYNQFVNLFTDLLFNNYYNRIKDLTVERIEYVNENALSDSKAEVQTIVHSAGQKYTMEYRLYKKDGAWLVYDVIVEGISMVNNYRTQFDVILQKQSPSVLIEKLITKSEL